MAIEDRPVNPGIEQWTARRVLDQHVESYPAGVVNDPARIGKRCARCRNGQCDLLEWAKWVLTANAPRFFTRATPQREPPGAEVG